MPVGKKPAHAEVKRIRSCFVRLEKVKLRPEAPAANDSQSTTTGKATRPSQTPNNNNNNNSSNINNNNNNNNSKMPEDNRKYNGPLKKRPINQMSTSATTTNTTASTTPSAASSTAAGNKLLKPPGKRPGRRPKERPSIIEEHIETVAAGRSRRSIKPNPKYSGKDMVLTHIAKSPTTITKKPQASATSKSGLEDFFNHESSDELGDPELDDFVDKAFKLKETDSDYSVDIAVEEPPSPPPPVVRKRGRPRKHPVAVALNKTAPAATTAKTSASNEKSPALPAQVQQLRNKFANSSASGSPSLAGRKRKLEGSGADSPVVDRKRFVVNSYKVSMETDDDGGEDDIEEIEDDDEIDDDDDEDFDAYVAPPPPKTQPVSRAIIGNRKPVLAPHKVNGSKLSASATTNAFAPKQQQQQQQTSNTKPGGVKPPQQGQPRLPGRPLLTSSTANKSTSSLLTVANSGKPTTPLTKQQLLQKQHMQQKLQLQLKQQALHKQKLLQKQEQRVASPAASAQKTNESAKSSDKHGEDDSRSSHSQADDSEATPTFTIVNIHDIINKKGDVLISKTGSKLHSHLKRTEATTNSSTTKLETAKSANSVATAVTKTSPGQTAAEGRLLVNRRKPITVIDSFSSDKTEVLSTKGAPARTSPGDQQQPKKVTHTILNHTMFNKAGANQRSPKLASSISPVEKPVPRILNSMVAKKTQPVKPMITNFDDSADESFPLSLGEDDDDEDYVATEDEKQRTHDEEEEDDQEEDDEDDEEDDLEESLDAESEDDKATSRSKSLANNNKNNNKTNTSKTTTPASTRITSKVSPKTEPKKPLLKRKLVSSTPYPVAKKTTKLRGSPIVRGPLAPSAVLTENNKQRLPVLKKANTTSTTLSVAKASPSSKPSDGGTEKVVVQRQGDKIIKKITCFETWFVINVPPESPPRQIRNTLEIPLVELANAVKSTIKLPSPIWSSKVTLSEMTPIGRAKTAPTLYTGDLKIHKIPEADRAKYQPTCLMFRRAVQDRAKSRLPFDRALIFKNRTYYTNIDGKNVRLVGAPTVIASAEEVQSVLEILEDVSLKSPLVEMAPTVL